MGFSFAYQFPPAMLMGPVRIRHNLHDLGWQSSDSVDLAGWQAKMASIESWIPLPGTGILAGEQL